MMHLIPVRALVIDDDASVCRKLAGWLTEAAVDVVTFTDAAAGLEHAKNAFSRIAMIDLRLPDVDGLEVIAKLRRVSPRSRIIAMTAFPEVAQVIAAIRAGARDILEKPIQPAALLAAIERQLGELGVSVRSEEEYNRRLGARIRAVRAEASLTLNDVSSASGLTAAQLSHIELGKTATSTWTLARICSALNTPLATLLGDV
jgi:DNA-binding NtrC family response regulator